MTVPNELMHPAIIWFVVGLAFLLAELFAPGLVIVFFGVGAWVVAFICLLTPISIDVQLIIFLVSSGLVLLLLRNWFKTLFYGHTSAVQNPTQDLKDFIGQKVVVKETIVPNRGGKVELNGTLWSAVSDGEIAAGETVKITGKENLTLKVVKL